MAYGCQVQVTGLSASDMLDPVIATVPSRPAENPVFQNEFIYRILRVPFRLFTYDRQLRRYKEDFSQAISKQNKASCRRCLGLGCFPLLTLFTDMVRLTPGHGSTADVSGTVFSGFLPGPSMAPSDEHGSGQRWLLPAGSSPITHPPGVLPSNHCSLAGKPQWGCRAGQRGAAPSAVPSRCQQMGYGSASPW